MGDVASFLKDTMDVIMTPFKAVFETITGTVTEAATKQVNAIEDAVDRTGLPGMASDIVAGVGSAAGGLLDTGEHILEGGADTLFGMGDALKYLPMVAVGFLGLIGLKYGGDILAAAEKRR